MRSACQRLAIALPATTMWLDLWEGSCRGMQEPGQQWLLVHFLGYCLEAKCKLSSIYSLQVALVHTDLDRETEEVIADTLKAW